MRPRSRLRYLWLTALAPAALAAWLYANGPVAGGDFANYASWSPTPADTAAQVANLPVATPPRERERRFAHLFQERFRSHGVAVAARVLPGNRASLLCGAYIPRWYMARMAGDLEREAQAVLGKAYAIDIYETYIGAARRKVGELRRDPTGGRIHISFNPPYSIARADLPPAMSDPSPPPVSTLVNYTRIRP